MKFILLTGLLILGVPAWGQNGGGAANTLTPEEQKQGFELLFDGRTLDKFDVTPELAKIWKAENGVIKNAPEATGGTMLTKQDFANFVFKGEFRCHPDINSAFMIRQPRPGSAAAASAKKGGGAAGYEVQIRDKSLTDRTGGGYLTGGIVNVAHAPEGTRILPNQWNTVEVTANGDHLVVIFNGKKTVDVRDARLASGAIGLQSRHPEDAKGGDIHFRNLKIKRLP
jgi:Domain of Unknown Function (DUF1080)